VGNDATFHNLLFFRNLNRLLPVALLSSTAESIGKIDGLLIDVQFLERETHLI
jgi:hypothetical protein